MNSNGYCNQCPGKCHHSRHYHSTQTTTYQDKTVDEVLADVEANYDNAKADQNRAASQVQTTQSAIDMLNAALHSAQQKLIQQMETVKRVASRFRMRST